jgi:single-strand DNA-binding protein
MAAQTKESTTELVDTAVNEVRLVGRLSQPPEERSLPSGDPLWTFRVVVPRPAGTGRATVDAVECSAWTARVRRSVGTWEAGDLVEVEGALRRRFYRTQTGAASRVEVEVSRVRRVRRAGGG